MTGGFTNKEMLVRILDKQEKMEDKIDTLMTGQAKTNGKVKLHTKALFLGAGIIITIIGWILNIVL